MKFEKSWPKINIILRKPSKRLGSMRIGCALLFRYDTLQTYKLLSQNIPLSSSNLLKLNISGTLDSMKTAKVLLKQIGHKNTCAISG